MTGAGLRRRATVLARRAYHGALEVLPSRVALSLQSRVSNARLSRDVRRPPRPLHLAGSGPVVLVDCRGLDGDQLSAAAASIASGSNPVRHVLVIDRPDFLGLRARGLSFEYIPPRDTPGRWFADDAAYAAFVEQRLSEIRTSLNAAGPLDRSFIPEPG